MTDTIEATLIIELNVSCPKCGNYFNLLDYGGLNDEGEMINAACPSIDWSESHKNFREEVNCPDCDEKMIIEGISW